MAQSVRNLSLSTSMDIRVETSEEERYTIWEQKNIIAHGRCLEEIYNNFALRNGFANINII